MQHSCTALGKQHRWRRWRKAWGRNVEGQDKQVRTCEDCPAREYRKTPASALGEAHE